MSFSLSRTIFTRLAAAMATAVKPPYVSSETSVYSWSNSVIRHYSPRRFSLSAMLRQISAAGSARHYHDLFAGVENVAELNHGHKGAHQISTNDEKSAATLRFCCPNCKMEFAMRGDLEPDRTNSAQHGKRKDHPPSADHGAGENKKRKHYEHNY